MKNLLALAILFTALQAETITTCHHEGRELVCETEADPYEESRIEEMRERQQDHWDMMELHAKNAAASAEFQAMEAEIYRLNHE